MTKKLRLVLIAVLAFIACSCYLAGCTLKPSLDDVLNDLNGKGAVVAVTYFANDGNFNDKSDKDKTDSDKSDKEDEEDGKDDENVNQGGANSNVPKNNNGKVRTIHYKVGSKAININSKSNFESGSITVAATDASRYELVGWYIAKTDGNGNPLYEDGTPYEFNYDTQYFDSTKKIAHTGELFDFSTSLEKDKHYYLVAEWRKIQTVHIILSGEVSSITVAGKTYNKGDLLNDMAYESREKIPKPNNPILGTVSNATFVEYYSDEECTKLFEGWPILFNDHKDDDPENPFTIYAKYIEGMWTVVKNVNQVTKMFNDATSETNQYYILNDIDCGGKAISAIAGHMGFACTIRGNGCTISNLKVTGSFSVGTSSGASLFGEIQSTAKISNLHFENIIQEYTVYSKAEVLSGIYFAFSSIDKEAKIEGVTLSGTMTVEIKSDGYVNNLQNGAKNSWKFGGYTNDSDYVGGISVTDETTLEVK